MHLIGEISSHSKHNVLLTDVLRLSLLDSIDELTNLTNKIYYIDLKIL